MSEQIRVFHLTTHNEECGIARYQEQFVEGMRTATDIQNVFFNVSPNKTRFMSEGEYSRVLSQFAKQLKDVDILHIQHELSFYKHKELDSVIKLAHNMGKKVIVTIHTALDVEYNKAHFRGIRRSQLIGFVRELRIQKGFERIHLNPLKKADLIIVHNDTTKQSLVNHGFKPARIQKIRMPVPKLSFNTKSSELKSELKYKKGDVIFCTVGFISRTKGVDHAVKALALLPKNYKLAIIGGMHPKSTDQSFLNELTELIKNKGLKNRIHITGYVEDDDRMNALIRESDICVYPYDAHYYSYVSSAALSNALANHKATIAYPTQSLIEINLDGEVIKFCKESNETELAKEIGNLDIPKYAAMAKQYAERFAYDKEAIKFAGIYRELVRTKN